MKNKKWVLISTSLLSFLSADLTYAGNMPGTTTASLSGAYYHFNHRRDMDNKVIPEAALSYNFTEHWAIEGTIAVINTESHDVDETDDNLNPFGIDSNEETKDKVHGMLYTIDGIYRFTPYERFEPYVVAGIGVLGLKPNGDDTVQSGVFNAGVGTQLFLSPTIALRGEFNDVYSTTGSYKNDYRVILGVSVLFGGGQREVYKGALT